MTTKNQALGQAARVDQVMSQPVFCCGIGDSLNVAAQLMWEHDCGVVPIVDPHGRIEGIVTDRDICMAAYTQGVPLASIPVVSAMSRGVYACASGDTLQEAEALMRDRQVRRLPVVDAEMRPLGIVSLSDIVRFGADSATRRPLEHEVTDTLASICAPRHEALSTGPETAVEA